MGDRTWTGISFSGHITEAQAQELVEELKGQGCMCDGEGEISIEHLRLDTCFYDEECNYANMHGVEDWCRDNHVGYLKTWAPGGGYGEGAELYIAVPGVTISVPQCEGEAALTVSKLREFQGQGASLDDVIRYVDQVENYRKHYPPLEIVE